VLTNVEYDHMENFETEDAFRACFSSPVTAARKAVVYCADDSGANEIAGNARSRLIGYGTGDSSLVRADNIERTGSGMDFDLILDGECAGRVQLPVPGRHNVVNACGAAAAGWVMGLDMAEICSGLEKLQLPRRRFEVLRDRDPSVISDYAHHPSEIRALVSTARQTLSGRLCGVFQPHRYTRTLALGADFPPAFSGLDELVLVPVYAASERPLAGGRVGDLYARFRETELPGIPVPLLADSLDQAGDYLKASMGKGESLLVIGAGDVEKLGAVMAGEHDERGSGRAGEWASDLCSMVTGVRENEPLAGKTTYKVGGMADIWIEFQTGEQLSEVMRYSHQYDVPFHVTGGGSNLLVSDLGVRGVSGRLSGDAFKQIMVKDSVVTVGCGCATAKLLGELEKQGLSGLEFLDSIPGTVGGALRMNAGAWGQEVGEQVLSIQCLNPDGSSLTVRGEDGEWAYRFCGALKDRVAVAVELRLVPSSSSAVAVARSEFRERRRWMRGLRCAGSVFRNPRGDSAGRLLEAAGLKGARVGGASVSEAHANVIVTDDGATASDVKALAGIMSGAVLEDAGIRLEMELVELG
jgi:UDP-N-acetylenolpyruvoylglucosamine reductase